MEERRTRTQWKPQEWELIIRELIKDHPIAMSSKTMVGIKAREVKMAMEKVLPFDRWRASMNMDAVRPTLIKNYSRIKRMMDEESAAEVKAKKLQALKAAGLHNLSEEAVDEVVKAVIDKLEPILEMYVDARIKALFPHIPVADIIADHHRHISKPKVPRIGVIGLLPIQRENLKTSFPNLDFYFVDNEGRETKTKLRNMDAIFGLVSKMDHRAEDLLRSMPDAWANYRRVGGKGTSAVKRMLETWVKDNTPKTMDH